MAIALSRTPPQPLSPSSSSSSNYDQHQLNSPLLLRSQNTPKSSPWITSPSKTVYSLVAVAFVFFQILFAIHSQISLRTIVANGNRWHAASDEEVTAAMDAAISSKTDGLFNDVRTLWSDSQSFPQTKLIRHAAGTAIRKPSLALG